MFRKVILLVVILLGVAALSACTKSGTNTNSFTAVEVVTGAADVKIKEAADKNLAIAQAKELWRMQFQLGAGLSARPCLSNNAITDWVADIAHNPRTAVDDKPENQCSAYRDGTAHHFVELDPEGNLIRAQ
jgi:hypothetical protein